MTDKFIKVEEESEHPLEDFFNITPGTTVTEHVEHNSEMVVVDHQTYDEKDKEIEGQFEEVYNAAMETFYDTIEAVADIEPKYKNKSREVAVQFLNAALMAADKKAVMKANKDKLEHKVSTNNYTQNNLIFDRNELLEQIRSGKTIENLPDNKDS